MKKSFFILILVFLSFPLFSQDSATDPGVILIKGSSNLDIKFSDGSPVEINVGGGYFIMKNIVLGADIEINSVSFNSDRETRTSLRPFARYYYNDKFFGGLSLLSQGDNTVFNLEAGYLYFLNDFVALEPSLVYPLVEDSSITLEGTVSIYF